MSGYSVNTALVTNSAILSSLVRTLNEKGVISTPEATTMLERAYANAVKGSEKEAEVRTIFTDMFPNLTFR